MSIENNKSKRLVVCVLFIQVALLMSELGSMNALLIILLLSWVTLSNRLVSSIFINLIALISIVIIVLSSGFEKTLTLFVLLLLTATGLKLKQANTPVLLQHTIVLAFFSTTLTFLFSQSLWFTVVVVFQWLLLIASLALSINANINVISTIKTSARSLLLLSPLALLMLFLFPKLPSFWSMPNQSVAKTGLSGELDPFKISELSNSDEVVFRAKWGQEIPKDPLYWRAIVHDRFDGRVWQQSRWLTIPSQLVDNSTNPMAYSIIAETSSSQWLYGLSWSTSSHSSVHSNGFGTLFKDNYVTNKFEYDVISNRFPKYHLSESQIAFYTRLPVNKNPQAIELSQQLSKFATSTSDYIDALKLFFQSQKFKYTLTPPSIHVDNAIDSFLVNTKLGFCGHYASSSAFLLRAAGIPSRIVSGYLGGKLNQEQRYTTVRQFEAHAWVEYYDGTQWQTLDPTGWIAPERLQGSLLEDSQLRAQLVSSRGFEFLGLSHLDAFYWLRDQFDSLDYQWSRWVVAFDRENQSSFFSTLLGNNWYIKTAAILIGTIFVAFLVYFTIGRLKANSHNPIPVRLCLSLLHVSNLEDHSPISACNVLKQRYPEYASDLDAFCKAFMEYRYNGKLFPVRRIDDAKRLISNIKIKEKRKK
ncbi:transglutaminase TgpA family protein [Pseudoalteromonas xiamenensis]